MSLREFNNRRVWGPNPRYDRVKAFIRKDRSPIYIAGPCSVESENQIFEIARSVKDSGATHLRGGVFRAGTYPSNAFGLMDNLLKPYHEAAKMNGLKNIIEVIDIRQIDRLMPYADCFQVGCRQMQNYPLLRELGHTKKTVFLKRHPGSTIDEFLGAAEHLLVSSSCFPALIERGSSTHDNHVRWNLSISTISAIKKITDIPILVDASHGTGRSDLVEPMTYAGIAAGADGCLIETHYSPENSLSDADQAVNLNTYSHIMKNVRKIRSIVNG